MKDPRDNTKRNCKLIDIAVFSTIFILLVVTILMILSALDNPRQPLPVKYGSDTSLTIERAPAVKSGKDTIVEWKAIFPLFFHPVTKAQILAFLEQDPVNLNQYGQIDPYGQGYYCSDFAADLVAHASRGGIQAWSVGILFTHEIGHVIVAFPTSDGGIVYVEPQTDAIYPLVEVGQPACAANFCPGNGEGIRKLVVEIHFAGQ